MMDEWDRGYNIGARVASEVAFLEECRVLDETSAQMNALRADNARLTAELNALKCKLAAAEDEASYESSGYAKAKAEVERLKAEQMDKCARCSPSFAEIERLRKAINEWICHEKSDFCREYESGTVNACEDCPVLLALEGDPEPAKREDESIRSHPPQYHTARVVRKTERAPLVLKGGL